MHTFLLLTTTVGLSYQIISVEITVIEQLTYSSGEHPNCNNMIITEVKFFLGILCVVLAFEFACLVITILRTKISSKFLLLFCFYW